HASRITVKGHWDLMNSGDNYRVIEQTDDGNTVLEFDNKDAMPIEIELVASDEQGNDGEDGQDGTDGEEGQDGIDGEEDQDGKDGEDGQDGTDGEDGQDGTDGEDGQDGIDGEDGQDGIDEEEGKTGVGVKPDKRNQSSNDKGTDEDNNKNVNNEGKELPKTATSIFNLLWIGLGLVLVGLLLYFFKIYKTRHRHN